MVTAARHAVDERLIVHSRRVPGPRVQARRQTLGMDVSGLFSAADRMDEHAALLRARAAHIGAGVTNTRWYSPAGRRYLRLLDETIAELTGCAARLTTLAEQVRSHAHLVRQKTQ